MTVMWVMLAIVYERPNAMLRPVMLKCYEKAEVLSHFSLIDVSFLAFLYPPVGVIIIRSESLCRGFHKR